MRMIRSVALGTVLSLLSVTVYSQARVVISQVYGGAGCGTANCSTYKNDYIEIFNAGDQAQNLSGWSVQYTAASGTAWQVTNLSGTLQPGQYYLISEAAGANGINTIPTADATGTIAMSATAAKVAVVNTTTSLSGLCPSGVQIIDFVGYGTVTSCFEGAGYAPAPSVTNAIFRASGGCTDANNNSTDFSAAVASPRNSTTALAPCGILPVSFMDFKAQYNEANRNVSLTWSTAQEQNAKEFQIEHSKDGSSWSTIAVINAAGNSNAPNRYNAKDLYPVSGTNLYRIKQVDIDGHYILTGIIGIKVGTSGRSFLKLFPNPAKGKVLINASLNAGTPVRISITDITGKEVMREQRLFNATAPLELNLNGLDRGTYFVQLAAEGYFVTEKLIVY